MKFWSLKDYSKLEELQGSYDEFDKACFKPLTKEQVEFYATNIRNLEKLKTKCGYEIVIHMADFAIFGKGSFNTIFIVRDENHKEIKRLGFWIDFPENTDKEVVKAYAWQVLESYAKYAN